MLNILYTICKYISPALANEIKYLYGVEEFIKDLINAIVDLEAKSQDVINKVEIQERQGLQRLEFVQLWISRVEDIGPQVCLILEDSEVKLQRLHMYGLCFKDYKFTYRHAKMVSNVLKKVELLLSSIPVEVVAGRVLPPQVEVQPIRSTIGLEKILDTTWEQLMKKEVGILGLYGIGGVGKTTLLDQINNKFSTEMDVFLVIYVVVSQDLQIEKIQQEIGKRLGLDKMDNMEWEKKNKREKASCINKILTRNKFVMMLDDIWRKVELEEIGIPLPNEENRSKVVFATRKKAVCGRMGAHVEIEVTCLDPENAWKLFEKTVRPITLEAHPKILELAKIVCGKCKGLPLALIVIGQTMTSKTEVYSWQHAIKELNSNMANPEVGEDILKILKFSFDDLKNENVKQCFQYCALFPEDHLIDKQLLVEYLTCEGIITRGGDREEAMNEGFEIINFLINVSLLIDRTSKKVGMHDVIRQMALWTASNFGESKEIFVVKSGCGLNQMPEVRDWNLVKRMSLQNNEIENISVSPDCPNLLTLILRQNKLVKISSDFFLLMPNLVVLDLSENQHLITLPEEVSNLVSLQYLRLSATNIKSLPQGLRKLIKLRNLDLTGVLSRPSINMISCFIKLEILTATYSTFLTFELIKDLKSLKDLKVLDVSIKDFDVFQSLLSNSGMARCIERLQLQEFAAKTESLAWVSANLQSLYVDTCLFSDTRRLIRFQNLACVKLTDVRGIKDLTWLLLFAPKLKFLYVVGPSHGMKEIISRDKVYDIMNEVSSMRLFEDLFIIYLRDLSQLKSIYWEPLNFRSLTIFAILNCQKLKSLPLNNESAKGNNITIEVSEKEWLDKVEWVDEATKNRFLPLCNIRGTQNV